MRKTDSAPRLQQRRIDVWDAPVRVVHWLTALCFLGAYLTSEERVWRSLHVAFGYTTGGLIAFRLIWGAIGTRYARFTNFVRGPSAAFEYLRSLVTGHPQHFIGHNPAGGLAIIALLATGAAVTVSGWITLQESSSDRWEDVHETLANLMLMIVIVHIVAVITSSWLHHENLVASMLHGQKLGPDGAGIRHRYRSIGFLILMVVAGFWWLLWR